MSIPLSEFIQSTLVEIHKGVESARQEVDAEIAPRFPGNGVEDAKPQTVSFEVLVEVNERDASEVGASIKAKIAVIGAKLGSDTTSETSVQNAQKVSFAIPMFLQFSKPNK